MELISFTRRSAFFLVLVPQTHLPEHHGTKVDIPHHDGDRYVHDAAVAQVDVGAAPAHCLNSCQRIAAEATLARNGILSHDAAERGTATVFRDRLPLDVDADDGGTGQPANRSCIFPREGYPKTFSMVYSNLLIPSIFLLLAGHSNTAIINDPAWKSKVLGAKSW